MPFIINVGVSRKSSKDYQSTGYSLNLTAELDSALLADSERLQNEIERIYSQATIALNRQVEGSVGHQGQPSTNPSSVTVTVASLESIQKQNINRHRHQQSHTPNGVQHVPQVSSPENPAGETVTHNLIQMVLMASLCALQLILKCGLSKPLPDVCSVTSTWKPMKNSQSA